MQADVAIVGGGYVGAELARALDPHLSVVLIDPRSAFVHAPAMIRAVVRPDLLDRALIPYDRLLQQGQRIQARARHVTEAGVVLEDGNMVQARFTVIATGSANALPFRPQGADLDGLRAAVAQNHQALVRARRVVIVGAGAVGVELAGEIAHGLPGREITLVASQDRLFPDRPRGFGGALARKLAQAGVRLVLGRRAIDLPEARSPFVGRVTLSDGEVLEGDLIFPVTGARPETGLFRDLPGARFDAQGRAMVDCWLRPSDLPGVFAAGDAAATGDAMTIVAISRQVPWLARSLKALAAGQAVETLKPFVPWRRPPILVPLGPHRGNSDLGLLTVGDLATGALKGRHLFVPKYRRLFRQG